MDEAVLVINLAPFSKYGRVPDAISPGLSRTPATCRGQAESGEGVWGIYMGVTAIPFTAHLNWLEVLVRLASVLLGLVAQHLKRGQVQCSMTIFRYI